MNLLSGISAGFKAVFGVGQKGSDNVMTVAKGIGGYINDLSYTDAEKAEKHSTIIIPAFQAFMDSTVKENTERSRTRREIAIWVIRNWFIMLWVAILSYGFELVIGATRHEFSAFVLAIATLQVMVYLVLGVGAFFFGSHIIRQTGDQFKK